MKKLKENMLNNAEHNLKKYQELLETLQYSNLKDKEERIKQCQHSIEKQKQILKNIEEY